MLAEANRLLTDRREQLQQEKQEAEEKRESLRAEVKTADDVAAKRLQTKLNRDKTQEAKELLAEEAQIQVYFDDVKNKLDDEKKKFDELLAGRQEIEEKLRRRTAKKDEDTAVVAEQDAKLAELKALIEEEQKTLDEQTAALDLARKTNKVEESHSRDLNQKNAALTAKLQHIEQFYDYKEKVQGIPLDVFAQVMKTNQGVNETVTNFASKLDATQKDTFNYLSMKNAYNF